MSSAELPDRPSFRAVDHEDEVELVRTSRTAIGSFVVGLLSLSSFLSIIMLPLAALAILMGVVSLIRIVRDPTIRGSWLAQLGLGLGIISIASTVTFANEKDKYLYQIAGSHAETFLDYLSREDTYHEALELLRSEQDRQITGTDLKAYYENIAENPDEDGSEGLEVFLSERGTKIVLASKGSADWRYQRGIRTWGTPDNSYVVVELKNEARGTGQIVHVTMQRIEGLLVQDEGQPTAHWNVYDLRVP